MSSLNQIINNIKKNITIVVAAAAIILGLAIYLGLSTSPAETPGQEKQTPGQSETGQEPLTPVQESAKPGIVGETETSVKQEQGAETLIPIGSAEMPVVVFNTLGTIKQVKADRVIVLGNGSNFADKQPRELTLIITKNTVISEKGQKKWYKGLAGLKYLNPGEEITLQASENIRGKTEFKIDYLNKI